MADINLAYAAASDVTITLASLASDVSLLAGRESAAIDNTTTLYLDMLLSGKITTGTLPTNAKSIEVWAVGSWDGTTWPDVFDGTNSAETITSTDIKTTICRLVASISTDNTSGNAYHFGPTSLASVFGGNLPPKMVIFVTHNTGVALSATAGHHQIRLLPVYQTLSGSVPAYTLPTATNSVLGGVKIGSGVSITDGVISVSTGTTDVYEYASESLFPATGAANTIYIDKDTSRVFRWTNSVYVEIGPQGGGVSKTIQRFTPRDNQPPASAFATLDQRNNILVLEFDASTEESAYFVGVINESMTLTSGLTVRLWWMGDTATSGNVQWGVQFEKTGTDLDADSFDSNAQATSAASGTSGVESVASITITTIDSLTAGDRYRLRVYRVAADATNDTMTGDAQLVAVELRAA